MHRNPYAMTGGNPYSARVGARVGDVSYDVPNYGSGLEGPYFRPAGMPPPLSMDPRVPSSLGPRPPGCAPNPCGPEAWYAAADARRSDQARRAARQYIINKSPQIPLTVNTLDDGPTPGTPVPAGGSVTLSATPSVALWLVSFVVARTSSSFFLIDSMRMARRELLADGGGMPADAFSADSNTPPSLKLGTIYPGTQISISVRNVDAAPRHFIANWWGIDVSQGTDCFPLFAGDDGCP